MLKTDYKDDILNTDVNVNRKFNIVRSNGTLVEQNVELRETTVFEQEGDSFGAKDINETNEAIVDVRGQIHTNLLDVGFESVTKNGITFTNNNDGTVTMNGTATTNADSYATLMSSAKLPIEDLNLKAGEKYALVCGGGSSSTYLLNIYFYKDLAGTSTHMEWAANGTKVFTVPTTDANYVQVGLRVKAGKTMPNVVVKPMLTTDLSADYDSFVKYSGSEERLNEQVASLHESSKGVITNLLNTIIKAPVTTNGVTCTPNGDGTFIVNGTASAEATFNIITWGAEGNRYVLGDGASKLRVVGCPKGGSSNTFKIQAFDVNSSGSWYEDYGNGVTFDTVDGKFTAGVVRIDIKSGVTCNNLLFKPMLTTDLDATYNDYVPYSGDGRLNENVADIYNKVEEHETRLDSAETTIGNHTSTLATHTNEIASLSGKDGVYIVNVTGTSDGNGNIDLNVRPQLSGYDLTKIINVIPIINSNTYFTLVPYIYYPNNHVFVRVKNMNGFGDLHNTSVTFDVIISKA